jgi:hypothetical protein
MQNCTIGFMVNAELHYRIYGNAKLHYRIHGKCRIANNSFGSLKLNACKCPAQRNLARISKVYGLNEFHARNVELACSKEDGWTQLFRP